MRRTPCHRFLGRLCTAVVLEYCRTRSGNAVEFGRYCNRSAREQQVAKFGNGTWWKVSTVSRRERALYQDTRLSAPWQPLRPCCSVFLSEKCRHWLRSMERYRLMHSARPGCACGGGRRAADGPSAAPAAPRRTSTRRCGSRLSAVGTAAAATAAAVTVTDVAERVTPASSASGHPRFAPPAPDPPMTTVPPPLPAVAQPSTAADERRAAGPRAAAAAPLSGMPAPGAPASAIACRGRRCGRPSRPAALVAAAVVISMLRWCFPVAAATRSAAERRPSPPAERRPHVLAAGADDLIRVADAHDAGGLEAGERAVDARTARWCRQWRCRRRRLRRCRVTRGEARTGGGGGQWRPSRRRRRRGGKEHAAQTHRRLPRRQERAAAVGEPGLQCRHSRRGHLSPPHLEQHRRCADHRRRNDRLRCAGAAEQRGEAASERHRRVVGDSRGCGGFGAGGNHPTGVEH